MNGQTTPIGMNLSASAEKRHDMVSQSMEALEHFAYRALYVLNLKNDEVVVVCIKVDSQWRDIVDMLMPDTNWQQWRDKGQEPVARGSAMFRLCHILAQRLPDITDVLLERPPDGKVKCIALDEGGCTVYEIVPIQKSV